MTQRQIVPVKNRKQSDKWVLSGGCGSKTVVEWNTIEYLKIYTNNPGVVPRGGASDAQVNTHI